MTRPAREFFGRYTPKVARDLLGCRLVRVVDGIRMVGIIVETEAYRGAGDPASHAFRGKTVRNQVMFGEPGHAYVYFTYGFHHLLNITTEPPGKAGAVLIRAIAPVEGLGLMMKNRGVESPSQVADGPGKLTRALKIDRKLTGEDVVTSDRLFIEEGGKPGRVRRSGRVGIQHGAERKWRYYVPDSEFVSKARPSRPQNP